jgi:hypothetical protein
MQPPNRTKADQVSKREGLYTMFQSEKHFMWKYYYQRHPLGDTVSPSCVLRPTKIIFQTTFVLQMFLLLLTTVTAKWQCKSASPVTAVVIMSVKRNVLYNTLYCNSVSG